MDYSEGESNYVDSDDNAENAQTDDSSGEAEDASE